MMNDRELLSQISLLKNIKPTKAWVSSTRSATIGESESVNLIGQMGQMLWVYSKKPVFAMAAFVLLLSAGLVFQIERENLSNNKIAALKNDQKLLSIRFVQVSNTFAQLVKNEPKKALQASREIVQLQREKSQLEKTLGAKFNTQESNNLEAATKILVQNEIADLDSRTLTAEQLILLNDAKNAYVKNDYQTALEKIWILSN